MNGQGNGAKAWEIIGYTYEGEAYCLPCGHYLNDSAGTQSPNPFKRVGNN
jgi:hypothetical protein